MKQIGIAASAQTAPLLNVHNLEVQFRTEEGPVKAVNGVSFDVKRGEVVAIVGESGCGKSVTALALLRLIPQPPGRITGGEIWFDGRDLVLASDEDIRGIRGNRIAMIFQEPMTSLNPVHTIGRQVGEPVALHKGLGAKATLAKTVALLQSVNIPEPSSRVDNYPHQFSGGMRQRAMIAMSMSCVPDLIVADEPTTALDVTIQAQLLELLKREVERHNTALLLITHNLGVVARYADRVNVMYAGRIVEQATADELYDRPRHPYTLGLLRSVPRLDQPSTDKLEPIQGQPPDPIDLPGGCPFHPRCRFAIDKCARDLPPLFTVSETHAHACWVDPNG